MHTEEIQNITGQEGNLHDFLSLVTVTKSNWIPSVHWTIQDRKDGRHDVFHPCGPVLHGSFTLFRIIFFNYFYICYIHRLAKK